MSQPTSAVEEVQGLYGPFLFAEKLLQKIWLRGDFNRAAAKTTDGRVVRIVHPGKWNLLGGPDFKGARLSLGDGPEITTDVELHLRSADWQAHGHARDAAYDRVGLHVVLFPSGRGEMTRGAGAREIPVLVLLPLLHHDLEEFAAEEAVEQLANRRGTHILEELGTRAASELAVLLHRHAGMRWRQKIHFARLRVQRLGWAEACHHAALEILGYRFNRAPMLRIGGAHPLAEWVAGAVSPDEVFAAEAGSWSVQGVRPANHPRTRLRQYAAWTQARPDWPERLIVFGEALIGEGLLNSDAEALRLDLGDGDTGRVRRAHGFSVARARLLEEICGGALGGPRLDTLVCDGLLPLLAARSGRTMADVRAPSFLGWWWHWFPGDLPPLVSRGLRELGVFDGRAHPAGHGAAQGLLGWLIERDLRG